MSDPVEINPSDAAGLTLLRRLVTVLLVVMILGFLLLIGLLVTRFSSLSKPVSFELPDSITLPEGTTAQSFTRGDGWVGVVSTQNEIFIFDAQTGALRQTLALD